MLGLRRTPSRSSSLVCARPAELQDVWVPQRVTDILKTSTSFIEYRKRRIFTFCHYFSGGVDVLGNALRRLAELDGITVKIYSLDRDNGDNTNHAVDLMNTETFMDLLDHGRSGRGSCRISLRFLFHGSSQARGAPSGQGFAEHLWSSRQFTSSTSRSRSGIYLGHSFGAPGWGDSPVAAQATGTRSGHN